MFERSVTTLTEYEFRGAPNDGGMPRFYGYAAVFNVDSEPLPFIETIAPGAFTRTLKNANDQSFVVDHDESRVLASRRTKRLALTEDAKGLYVESDLPATSYARDLVELHDRGEVRGMSFTFKPSKNGDSWSPDNKRRTLTDLRLGHVTAVTSGYTPAYRQTTASIRSLANKLSAEAEELTDAIESLRDGSPLDARSVALLETVIAELREQPAAVPIIDAQRGVPINVRQMQLALAAKQKLA